MPNINAPFGLLPIVKNMGGGAAQVNQYKKLVGTATPIYTHDVVRPLTSGDITAGGTPGTDLWLGVSLNPGLASTATTHQVIDDPDALFVAQDDGTSSGILEVDLRLNANLVYTAGDAVLLNSRHQIASSTKATTASLDVKLLRKAYDFSPINATRDEFGQFCVVELTFNQHVYKRTGAGV